MPASEFRLYFDNSGADEELIGRFSEIKVDQAIGLAAEAELQMTIRPDEQGYWPDIEEDFAQPMKRARVEVRIGTDDFVPLIDGPIVTQRFELSAVPGESKITLVVQDDSVLLNMEEKVEVFEDQTPDAIASTLMDAAGLDVEVDSVPDSGSSFTRYTVQRGTAMQLLRDLARRHGMFVYIRPGAEPGKSVGVFATPDLTLSDLPELLLLGAKRNTERFSIEFDALRPTKAAAGTVRISDKAVLSAESGESDQSALGDVPAHELVQPGTVMLTRTREEEADLDAATQAAANLSSWAFTATGEVTANMYAGVLEPYKVVRVSGAGGYLGGDYLVSRVTHVLSPDGYRQQFTLRRNARLEGTNGTSTPAGVF